MSAHHWIQGHCTTCGVKREKVRVQGPCAAELKTALRDLGELFELVKPSSRSIEPHKKRREK